MENATVEITHSGANQIPNPLVLKLRDIHDGQLPWGHKECFKELVSAINNAGLIYEASSDKITYNLPNEIEVTTGAEYISAILGQTKAQTTPGEEFIGSFVVKFQLSKLSKPRSERQRTNAPLAIISDNFQNVEYEVYHDGRNPNPLHLSFSNVHNGELPQRRKRLLEDFISAIRNHGVVYDPNTHRITYFISRDVEVTNDQAFSVAIQDLASLETPPNIILEFKISPLSEEEPDVEPYVEPYVEPELRIEEIPQRHQFYLRNLSNEYPWASLRNCYFMLQKFNFNITNADRPEIERYCMDCRERAKTNHNDGQTLVGLPLHRNGTTMPDIKRPTRPFQRICFDKLKKDFPWASNFLLFSIGLSHGFDYDNASRNMNDELSARKPQIFNDDEPGGDLVKRLNARYCIRWSQGTTQCWKPVTDFHFGHTPQNRINSWEEFLSGVEIYIKTLKRSDLPIFQRSSLVVTWSLKRGGHATSFVRTITNNGDFQDAIEKQIADQSGSESIRLDFVYSSASDIELMVVDVKDITDEGKRKAVVEKRKRYPRTSVRKIFKTLKDFDFDETTDDRKREIERSILSGTKCDPTHPGGLPLDDDDRTQSDLKLTDISDLEDRQVVAKLKNKYPWASVHLCYKMAERYDFDYNTYHAEMGKAIKAHQSFASSQKSKSTGSANVASTTSAGQNPNSNPRGVRRKRSSATVTDDAKRQKLDDVEVMAKKERPVVLLTKEE